ncbi:virion structural protein [Pseudomonas phage PA1C]|uniref:Virion structural protein n=1 Tax=Pseudomonas phage vB_PaeM_PS119XW TaxID=2601632 RepID=A0A5C1K6X5_9CAUD|nr:hypothetical protein PP933_gp108 [Pseudomonas phage vB_PaeM_PS119XW]QBX32263.1 virion structural protein [Pseudomonas phage PA1C]QEM41837.1 hypothetical protein [Pseudomonas phage vB_PaeM_PS119XW]BEG72745.1 hypothetical protein RVBP21_3730 [Pseudomonas phage BRkr]
MSVDSTLLMREVEQVTEIGESYSNFRNEIKILANKKWITPVRLDFLYLNRDYGSGQLGDIREVQFLIGYGDYVHDIVPYRDNLQVDVSEIPLLEAVATRNVERKAVTKRYRGIISVSGDDNPALSGKNSNLKSREAMNQIGLISVQMQLVDELTYKLMMVTCGTTYRVTTTMNALKSLWTQFGQLVGGSDSQRLLAIDIADGYSQEERNQIIIPDGMPLKDVHRFFQDKEGGIYSTGIGRYIQNQVLFLYPLYDTTRYGKNTKVLNLINVPNDRYQGAEKTFRNTMRHITVLATGDATSLDQGLAEQLQNGNSFRFGDARKVFQDFAIDKDNKMLVDRATNLFEVKMKDLETGFNNVRWAKDRLTSNPFKQYTDMARKQGQEIKLEWTHGNPDLLYPGMPVKFQTISDNRVKTYHGVLLGVNEQRRSADAGATVNRHVGKVTLGVFINRFEVTEDGIEPTP